MRKLTFSKATSFVAKLISSHKLAAAIIAAALVASTTAVSAAAINASNQTTKSLSANPTQSADKAVGTELTNEQSAGSTDKAVLAANDTATATTGTATPSPNPSNNKTTNPTPVPSQKPANKPPTPAPSPVPTPSPNCPECGGDPDKIPSRTGALILSGGTVTVASGNFSYSGLTARSDSGEAIGMVYVQYGPGVPMIMTSFSPDAYSTPFSAQRTFGFNVNMNVTPGTYNLKLFASGANKGMYSGYATVVVTAP